METLIDTNLSGIARAALEISKQRGEILRRLKDALLADNKDEALSLARQYCGLETDKTGQPSTPELLAMAGATKP